MDSRFERFERQQATRNLLVVEAAVFLQVRMKEPHLMIIRIFQAFVKMHGAPIPFFNRHHNHAELTQFLKDIHKQYPDITYLYSVGKSVRGSQEAVLRFQGRIRRIYGTISS